MNNSRRIAALILAAIMVLSLASGCGKKNKKNNAVSNQPGTAQTTTLMEKPEAKEVIKELKGNDNVKVVKESNGINKNVFSDTAERKFWVTENAASGGLDAVTYKLTYTKENRSDKVAEFFAQVKQIMLSCDSSMTEARANELVTYLREADKGYGVESVRTIENENGFNYAVHFLSEPQIDFVLGVNAFK